MNNEMLELGSKISLISKSDIRYEGQLFTLDTEKCTIALSSVRSFGTENRDTAHPVPPQNQVYDYILFRGSDIKDIKVLHNVPSMPIDPAIVQVSVPPSLGQQPFQTQDFTHPIMGHMGPQMSQFNPGYGAMGALGGLSGGLGMALSHDLRNLPLSKPSELLMPGPIPPTDLHPAVEPTRPIDHGHVLDLIGGGSRSATPSSLISRKSPTNDQGVQVSGTNKRDDKKVVRPIQPPGQRNMPKDRKDLRNDGQDHQQQKNQNRQNMNRNQQSSSNQHHPQQNQQGQQRQGGWVQRTPFRQRVRPRGDGFKGNQGQPNQQTGAKSKNTLKFENDYDFEKANTKFEELRSQLGKVKLEDAKPEVNGDSEKKDDSGNETGAGEPEQEEDQEVYYDKSKSFFDNISCEAVERSKGRSQRTDWRTERKLNNETFGVSAIRRGGYRGRGAYRGMGYRGGYRGGYRNQGPRRDQGNRTGQPTQSNQQPAQNNPSKSQLPPAPVPAAAGK